MAGSLLSWALLSWALLGRALMAPSSGLLAPWPAAGANQFTRFASSGARRSFMLRKASTVVSQSMQASVTETP